MEFETGFDADMFGGRAGLEFTWFKRVTSDIIVAVPLAPSLGSSSIRAQNLGEAQTSGFELGIGATVLSTDRIEWNLNLSGSKLTSKLNELGLVGVDFLGSTQRHSPGFPLGASWDYPVTWADSNGDGMLAESEVTVAAERQYIGPGLPQRELSLSSIVLFGDILQAYALIDYQGDYIAFNNTEGFRCQQLICRARVDVSAPLWDQARHVARDLAATQSEHGYREVGNFTKLREVSLTFFLPRGLVSRFRSSAASLTLSARNLITWTDYTGVDPELNTSGSGANFGTSEFLTQGIPRYITLRLHLTF